MTDGDYDAVGLTSADLASFDQSKIHEALAAHASPVPTFELYKVNRAGTSFAVIRVHEFAEVPIICARDVPVEKDPRDPHLELALRQGAIYVRTAGAQSVEIRSEAAMRELLGRAVRRTRETFLVQLAHVLAGRSPASPPSAAGPYDDVISAALGSFAESAATSPHGHWEVTVQPFPLVARRIPVDALLKRLGDSSVSLRGWPLPDVGTIERFDDAIGSASDWGQHHERWRFACSGLFVYAFRLSSDENPDYRGDLLVRDVLYTLTEITEFAKRLYGDDSTVESIALTVDLKGLEGRRLVDGPNVFAAYRHPSFARAATLDRTRLVSAADQIALEWTRELLFAMGYGGDRNVLEERQTEFLAGTFVRGR